MFEFLKSIIDEFGCEVKITLLSKLDRYEFLFTNSPYLPDFKIVVRDRHQYASDLRIYFSNELFNQTGFSSLSDKQEYFVEFYTNKTEQMFFMLRKIRKIHVEKS